MAQAQRIQRRRVKGWRKPEKALHIARPSMWGNPFRDPAPERAVELFRGLLLGDPKELPDDLLVKRRLMWQNYQMLRGRPLMCFCPLDRPCHGDVFADLITVCDEAMNHKAYWITVEEGLNPAAFMSRFWSGEGALSLKGRFALSMHEVEALLRKYQHSSQ